MKKKKQKLSGLSTILIMCMAFTHDRRKKNSRYIVLSFSIATYFFIYFYCIYDNSNDSVFFFFVFFLKNISYTLVVKTNNITHYLK